MTCRATAFVIAGDAWQMCRSGRADPARFGLTFINESGLWFIAQNLLRDLASLNRMEMLPWDVWGSMREPEVPLSDDDLSLYDQAAALTMGGDAKFPELREIYESDDRVRVPEVDFQRVTQSSRTRFQLIPPATKTPRHKEKRAGLSSWKGLLLLRAFVSWWPVGWPLL